MRYSKLFYQTLFCYHQHSYITVLNCSPVLLSARKISTSVTMSSPKALLLSSSNCHGYQPLEFAKNDICSILLGNNVTEVIFIPYAQVDYDAYTDKMSNIISPWGFKVSGIHTFPDPVEIVKSCKAIFIGGGNTFLLLKTLYDNKLVNIIKSRVDEGNLVYIGSSAGTNVATKSIHTTNDMPITYPPSFEAIGIVPFNINPHYIDVIESSTHKGETRDQRISEYLQMKDAAPVLGLREGSILQVKGNKLTLLGVAGAVLFLENGEKKEYAVGADMSFLLSKEIIR